MNNRQAGRRRGRGGQRQGGNPGRSDNGNRIDNRARGNAAQLLEKYKNLATDAQRSGDRVTTEYYLQFADHYFRVLAESRSRMEDGQARRPRDDEDEAEGVEDFGFEGDLGSPAYYQQPAQQQPQQDSDREDRPRRDRDANGGEGRERDRDRDRDDRPRQRADQPRDGARPRRDQSDDRPRRDQADDRPRRAQTEERPRREQANDERPGREREVGSEVRDERQARAPEASADVGDERPRSEPRRHAPEAAEFNAELPVAAAAEPPRRRGRPRREPVAVDAESHGLDVAVLPPAISVEAEPAASDESVPERPRRGRPRKVRDDEAVPPSV
jgi:hypothetical protein